MLFCFFLKFFDDIQIEYGIMPEIRERENKGDKRKQRAKNHSVNSCFADSLAAHVCHGPRFSALHRWLTSYIIAITNENNLTTLTCCFFSCRFFVFFF